MFTFWSKSKRAKSRGKVKNRRTNRVQLSVELLESRLAPAWQPIGPKPQVGWIVPNGPFAENVSGRVTSLAYSTNFDGNNHPGLFLGTAGGGVWRTDQPGAAAPNWRAVSDAPNTPDGGPPVAAVDPTLAAGAAAIGTLAVDPANPRVIYAGTGEANWSVDSRYGAGIMWSIDGGDNWTLVSGPNAASSTAFYRHAVAKIVIDPTVVSGGFSQYIYAAVVPAAQGGNWNDAGYRAVDGIYESRDAGLTWRKIFDGNAFSPAIVTDIDFTVGADSKINLFAGVANPGGLPNYHNGAGRGIWVGTYQVNAGRRDWTFTQLPQRTPANPNRAPAAADVLRIAFAADRGVGVTNPVVYAAVSNPNTAMLEAVYKTTDNGATWSRYIPAGNVLGDQMDYNLAIAIKPTNPNVVYLGGQGVNPDNVADFSAGIRGLLQSVNGGQDWVAIDRKQNYQGGVGSNVIPHPDHHALLVVSDGVLGRVNASKSASPCGERISGYGPTTSLMA